MSFDKRNLSRKGVVSGFCNLSFRDNVITNPEMAKNMCTPPQQFDKADGMIL
jgi:hypothetical protein